MERLTNHKTKKIKTGIKIRDALNKLAEYEDLEEVCTIGATVYVPHIVKKDKKITKEVVPYEVTSFHNDPEFDWNINIKYVAPDGVTHLNQCKFADIGKRVFLTKSEAEDALGNLKNTKIFYTYRDASNYKNHGAFIVYGTPFKYATEKIMQSLNDGKFFIPEEIEVPNLHFPEYNPSDDHPWHEFSGFEETNEDATIPITIEQLADKFAKASENNWNISENIRNLENIKKVRLNDCSEYNYGFYTDYDRVENGWKVSYGTTADIPYCPCCDSFGDHYNYNEKKFECGDFEVISTEKLEEIIKSFEEAHSEDDDYFIEYEH